LTSQCNIDSIRAMSLLRIKPLFLFILLFSVGSFSSAAEPTKPKQAPGQVKVFPPAGAEAIPQAPVDDEAASEKAEADDTIKVARPVNSDPVQIYGWLEKVVVADMKEAMQAKLDTGAMTSSIHAENQQIFERDGKKWVKFVVTDPSIANSKRYDVEAPLSRIVMIKEPGGESVQRNVVRLSFQIGERNIKTEFTLNNRSNMTCPVLIGLTTIQVMGWVDPSRTFLADDKILR
jgi:hypothetical protein